MLCIRLPFSLGKESLVKISKLLTAMVLCFTAVFTMGLQASAGTYSSTQTVNFTFASSGISIRNELGYTMSAKPYVSETPVTNVTNIIGYYRPTKILLNLGFIDIIVYYSTDGSTYVYGDKIENIVADHQYKYSIPLTSPTTIYSLAFVPNLMLNASITYSVSDPQCTRLLTDNTPPSITLQEQSEYSNTSVTITADVTDSESGVSATKWAMGSQPASYFASAGTDFTGSFSVSSGGTVTVYAKDAAGNESTAVCVITRLDASPPTLTVTVSGSYSPTNTISVTVTDQQSGVAQTKWAYGSYNAEYFATAGNTLTGSTISVTQNGVYTIFAVDNVGNTAARSVTVAYVDNTITISHPLSVSFLLNPNISTPFSSGDVILNNQSRIKVRVSLVGISNITKDSKPVNVSPAQFTNWNALTAAQSAQNIALGVKIKETTTSSNGWYAISNTAIIYGGGLSSPASLGVVNPGGSGTLSIQGKSGLAFSGSMAVGYHMILLFEAV